MFIYYHQNNCISNPKKEIMIPLSQFNEIQKKTEKAGEIKFMLPTWRDYYRVLFFFAINPFAWLYSEKIET